jgi:ribonuclease HI
MTITAAVDGSALGNPGPGGWAWVVDAGCWDAGGWPRATNNLGELTAVLELLRATAAAGRADEPLHVLADSQYAINVITKWRHGWRKRGWRKADKKPIANLETIQAIDREIAERAVTFEWVRGHAGHPLNEMADERARGAAEAIQAGRPVPSGPGFSSARALAPSPIGEGDGSGSDGLADGGDGRDRDDRSALVLAAEKRFLRAWIAGDERRLADLAAPGSHRGWPDGTVREGLAGPAPAAPRIGRITAAPAGPGTWLTTYTMRWEGGASLESSVWAPAPAAADGSAAPPVPEDGGPRLLWHQSTLRR